MSKTISSELTVDTVKIKNSEIVAWQNMMLSTHGWYVHYMPSTITKELVNIHTHGIYEKFKHEDFQIVIPLPDVLAQKIFSTLIDRIKDGDKFTNNQIVTGIIIGYSVKLVNAIDEDRIVLRIILPDKYSKLDMISMESPYHLQYTDLITNVRVH